jgi:membrane-bound serine protease (ClpP class)
MTAQARVDGRRTSPCRSAVRSLALLLIAAGLLLTVTGTGSAQPDNGDQDGPVYVLAISGAIDLGLAPYLQRVLEEAEEAGATAVVLDIDTPGGRLDAVLQMRDSLLDTSVRTVSFVDRSAFSAGALIALASDEIWFAPGSSMGAATPVDGGTGAPADAKVISAVRSTFRATAQERDRDPLVGEAMVDPAVAIDGLVDEGSLLTLTPDEAREFGYSDGDAADLDDLLGQLGLSDRARVDADPGLAERLVRFLTNPIIGSLLLVAGVLLVVGELFAGAFGIASLVGFGFLGTFFYGHLLAGLAGWEDAVLVGIGVVLILVEIFVIPGFGVPGVLGLSGVLGGGFLAMTNRDFDFVSTGQIVSTASTIAITFVVLTIGLIALLTVLSRRGVSRRSTPRLAQASVPEGGTGQRRGWLRWFGDGDVLASEDDEDDTDGSTEGEQPVPPDARRAAHLGAIGTALSDLRPAGVADFEGHRVDVVTEGDYLVAGDRVEVIHAERYRRVVRRARD